MGVVVSRSSVGEQWPEVVWKEHLRKPLKESLPFRISSRKMKYMSKKGCANEGRVSKGKLENLKDINKI